MKKILLSLFSVLFAINISGRTLYVNGSAAGDKDGTSWENAFTSLQGAIEEAEAGDEIWVAKGIYKPEFNPANTTGTTAYRDQTFMLRAGVKIYGGFAGGENTDYNLDDRDLLENVTILSGNTGTSATNGAYHVVMAFDIPYYDTESENNWNTVLDGVTISGGYAEANSNATINGVNTIHRRYGAGIYLYNSSIELNNIIVEGNNAAVRGSGVYAEVGSHPRIKNSLFQANIGTNNTYGSAICLADAELEVSGSTFIKNTGANWGTVALVGTSGSEVTITETNFDENTVVSFGGAIHVHSGNNIISLDKVQMSGNKTTSTSNSTGGGAICINAGENTIDMNEVQISSNTTGRFGGALYIVNGTNTFTFSGVGNELKNNTATTSGGAIYIANGALNTFNLHNVQMDGNKVTAGTGGAIHIVAGTNIFTATGSTFNDNTASTTGGVMHIAAGTNTLDLNEVQLSGNKGTSGGAVYIANGTLNTFNLHNVQMDGNEATSTTGGAIYLHAGTNIFTVTGTGNTFNDNIAKTFGGAMYINGGTNTLDLSEVQLSGNKGTSGGAIYIADGTRNTFNIHKVRMNGNSATSASGGAIHIVRGTNELSVTGTGNTFNNNTANTTGGAIHIAGGTNTLSFTGTTFNNNIATTSGGAIYLPNSTNKVYFLNTLITGNKSTAATSYGGGIYATGNNNTLNIVNTTISGNTVGSNASSNGPGICLGTAVPVNIHNSIIWSENTTVDLQAVNATHLGANIIRKGSLVKGYYDWADNNIPGHVSPLFNNTDEGDYTLQVGSPCIDTGDNSLYAVIDGTDIHTDTDVSGTDPRLWNAAENTSGGFIDMGAYEFNDQNAKSEILYVTASADDAGTGFGWTEAISLTEALKRAEANRVITQIWVAAGTYYPEVNPVAGGIDNRDKTFMLPAGVTIYGGFAGTESTLAERPEDVHIDGKRTILSGDLNENGIIDAGDAYHVVMAISVPYYGEENKTGGRNTILDGITISGGYANGNTTAVAINGVSTYRAYGAGIYLYNSSVELSNVIIENNTSSAQLGGGLYIGGTTTVTDTINIRSSKFNNNTAATGGAIYMAATGEVVNILNSLIYDNKATNASIYTTGATNRLNVVNTTITDSKASATNANGYGINTQATPVYIHNSIIWGNPTYIVVDIQGTGVITRRNSLVKGFNDWTNNNLPGYLSPLFVDGTYELESESPCIDTGDNNLYTEAGGDLDNDIDLAGNVRRYDATGANAIDMGAYEYADKVELSAAPILYVKENGTGDESGKDWDNAITFADALKAAKRNKEVTQIWVAAGTHFPEDNPVVGSTDDRDRTFMLPAGVKIYGGFDADSEKKDGDISDRPYKAETILSGDFNSDGTDAAYHVVMAFYIPSYDIETEDDRNTVLDGFTISGGNANATANTTATINGVATDKRYGAGIYLYHSSVELKNIIVENNNATQFGAGLYTTGIAVTTNNLIVTDTKFSGNTGVTGGAIYIAAGTNNIDIHSTEFYNNTATNGGGLYVANGINTLGLSKVQMYSNTAVTTGGVMYIAAGTNTVNLLNTLINGNTATGGYGGAIYAAAGTYNIVNTTIADNKTGNVANGYGIWLNAALTVNIHNSIIWSEDPNSTSEIMGTPANLANVKRQNSLVKGYYDWSNNNIAGHISPAFKGNGSYELESESPCIDAGDNGLYIGVIGTDTDLSGINNRLFNATATDDAVIDMGAYEYATEVTPKPSITKLYVKKGGSGNETGEDWDNAIGELADAISKAEADRKVEEIWVAKGTYSPSFDPVNASPGRDRTFILPEGVKIYGGFAPNLQNEDGAINERNLRENETILSGEDDVYHVVMAFNVSYYGEEEVGGKNTVLDGFTITGGNANTNNNVTINGQTINRGDGAGIYLYNSSLELKNITIKENSAINGGAIYISTPIGTPLPTPTVNLRNMLIHGNTATTGYGGGIYATGATNTLNIVNSTIADNETTANPANGYGIYLAAAVTVHIHNSIIWSESPNSTADIQGTLTNVTNNRYNSLIKGYNDKVYTNAKNNIPGYLSPLFNDDYTLKPCSPAIDRGDNSLYNGEIGTDKDLSGTVSRVVGGTIDIGAYEFDGNNTSPYSSVLYVDGRRSESGDGLSWATAIKELADAINIAEGSCEITEIWVAKGIYYPKYTSGFITTTSGTTARDQSFMLPEGVTIYGGFNGTEVTLAERPKDVHAEGMRTILSGDINSDGTGVHHVVMAFNIPYYETQAEGRNTVLDGITISGGNANLAANATINGQSVYRGNGAGMYLYNASIELNNVIFQDNSAINGGAIYVTGLATVPANLNIRSSKFYDNTVTTSGGAMYIAAGASTVNLLNTLIASNTAATQGGGIYATGTANRLNIVNTTIADNTTNVATNGPGIYTGVPTNIYNSIVWSESTTSEIVGTVTRKNSLVKGHNDKDGSNNIPGYISPLFKADYTLQPCSPAIEGGDNDLYRNADIGDTDIDNDTDLTGENIRLWDAAAGVAGGTIDMGAYEFASLIDLTGLTIYVDSAANDGGDGLTWATAFNSLDDAINMTERSCVVDSILVAKGTYTPRYDPTNATTPGRDRTFMLPTGVKIYGGYAGIKEANPYERDTETYRTILSGDLNNNGRDANDAYHVVMAFDIPYYGEDEIGGKNTVLDGITISGGYANLSGTPNINGVSPDRRDGAAMYLYNASPVLNDVIIEGNYSIQYGAGLYAAGNSYPRITNSVFQNNTGTNALYGAAIYLANASLEVSGSVFTANTNAGYGVIALNNTSVDNVVTITDTKINDNTVLINGGAIYVYSGTNILNLNRVEMVGNTAVSYGGAIYMNNGTNTVNLLNTLIAGNKTTIASNNTGGGGIYVTGADNTLNIVNTTIADNKVDRGNGYGYGIYLASTAIVNIYNSIIWSYFTDGTINSTSDIPANTTNLIRKNSLVKGFNDWTNGNLPGYISPSFVEGSYILQPCSPGMDTGDNDLYKAAAGIDIEDPIGDDQIDLSGDARLYGRSIDMGAYELAYDEEDVVGRLYVKKDATGNGSGKDWDNAVTELAEAINIAEGNCGVEEIWVAKGTYYPQYIPIVGSADVRDKTFVLPEGVRIYGGFVGGEEYLEDRDWEENETILSGNIGTATTGAYRVVVSINDTEETYLDGFIIKEGYNVGVVSANVIIKGATFDRRNFGSGMLIYGGKTHLNNVVFENNQTYTSGSALHIQNNSEVKISNSIFRNQTANSGYQIQINAIANIINNVSFDNVQMYGNTFAGSDLYIYSTGTGINNVKITDSEFYNNTSISGVIHTAGGTNNVDIRSTKLYNNIATGNGGAVYVAAGTNSVNLREVLIYDNTALSYGGAMYIAAGTNKVNLLNTLIKGNKLTVASNSTGGGGIYITGAGNTLNIVNTTIADNKVDRGNGYGNGIFLGSTAIPINIYNSIIWSDFTDGTTNSTADIYPVASATALDRQNSIVKGYNTYPPLFDKDYALLPCSPGIDEGSNELYEAAGGALDDDDLAGNGAKRVWDATENKQGGIIDIGAFEFNAESSLPSPIIYVNINVEEEGDGLSWENAIRELSDAIDLANTYNSGSCKITEIWVAKGTYYPLNIISGTDNRDKAFILPEDVKIYGGFAGIESSLEDRTDIHGINKTILSGDLNKNGGLDNADAYRVVASVANTSDTYLDGFIISGGTSANASNNSTINGISIARRTSGTGVLINSALTTLKNIIFENNGAYDGNCAALYIENSSKANLYNVTFRNHSTANSIRISAAAGIENTVLIDSLFFYENTYGNISFFITSASSGINNVDIKNSEFYENKGSSGIIYITGGTNNVNIHSTKMHDNTATGNGGVLHIAAGTNAVNLREVQIYDNTAVSGGAMYIVGSNTVNLRQVQLYGNTATAATNNTGGGAIFIADGSNTVNLLNTLIYGNATTSTANYAIYGGAIYATGNNNKLNIINTTIADNKAGRGIAYGYGIYLGTAVPVNIHNSIIWSNFTDGTANSISDIQPVANLTNVPQNSIVKGFTGIVSPLLDSDYTLLPCSPAIDGGDNDLYSAVEGTHIDSDKDLTGENVRLWDTAAGEEGGTIDMGAFEFTGNNSLPSSILYVNINAEEEGDGYSWASPIRELSTAIDRAAIYSTSACPVTEIWVAAGTYYPQTVPGNATANSYDKTFLIPAGVKIYGGFPKHPLDGTDEVDYSDLANIIDTRDLENDTTILSGDFEEDGRDANDARHVLLGINIPNDGNTVLDGFTVYGGNASGTNTNTIIVNGVTITGNLGGGMFLSNASPVLNNIVFENNYAGSQGGAVYVHNSEPVISNTSFNTNTSGSVAGAVYIDGTVGNILNPKFNNLVFTENSSPTSGGMFIRYTELTFNKGEFISNKSTTNGGGAISVGYGGVLIMSDILFDSNETSYNGTNAQGGAIYMQAGSTGNISNSVFTNNKSAYYASSTTTRSGGGAIYLIGEASDRTELSLINVLMYDNEARQFGGAMYSGNYTELNVINSTLTSNKSTHGSITTAGHAIYMNGDNSYLNIDNSIIWGNGSGDQDLVNFSGTLTRRYSLIASFQIEDNLNTGDNIGNILGTYSPKFDTDYTLKICSPCIDTGNNEYVTSGMETDLDGNPRIWNADTNQEDENGRVDMGAYEFNGLNRMPEIIYVNANTSNPGDGISWESPFQTFSEALDAVSCGGVKEIWVAEGTYYTTTEYGFVLPAGVKIYGGFPNPEDEENPDEPDMADRNWGKHPTVLSGNRQSYHIVVGVDIPYYETETETEINTTLDGFVIRESKVGTLYGSDLINGKDIYRYGGGGLYLHNASPVLRNIVITDNYVYGMGGGIYLTNDSKLRMINSVIHDNNAAGVYLDGAGNEFQIINTTIANNYNEGIYNNEGRVTVKNSIVWGNNSPENSIVGDIGSDYLERRYSMVGSLMTDTAGNIPSTNPAFLGSSFRLEPGSPLENKGSNVLYPLYGEDFEDEKDIEGLPRLEGTSIDIGAYEGAFCTENVTVYADGIMYVHPDGGGSGASWGCAYNSLSAALDKARELKQEGSTVSQIWVARGTYYPETFPEGVDDSDPRNKSFVLVQGVSVYGGFADNLVGTEGNTNDRPYQAETILSGDIGYGSTEDDQYKDDYTLVETDGSYRNTEDNAYHIVLAVNLSDDYYPTGLDGFVIEGGRADGISVNTVNNQTVENYNGAGIYAKNAIMSLDNVTVRYNITDLGLGKGGGLYLAGNRTTLNSSSYNTAEIYQYNKASEGGAMYVSIGTENLYLGNKTYLFEGNTATVKGGAGSFIEANRVSSDGNYLISFKNNRAENEGGALYLHSSDITFEKSVFENNKAGLGGAIYNESNEMYISGSFTSNEADIHGGAIYAIYDGEATFFNMVSGGSSKFQNNEAKQGNGGAVYAKGLVDMQYNYNASVTFTGNEALNGSGGAYYGVDNYAAHYHGENIYALFGSPVYIEKNRAKHAGGGFYLDTYQYILGEGFIVKNNTLSDAGSGVGAGIFNYNSYFRIGDLNVNDEERIWSQITGNTSTGDGGGLANYGGSKGTVRWVNISDNDALYGAGVSNSYSDLLVEDTDYYNSGLSFQNVKIESNYAAGDTDFERGGAAMFNGNASPRLVNTLIANNQINSIGGAGLFTTSAGDDVAAPVLVNVTVANNMVVSEDVQNPLSFTGAAMFNKGKNTQPSINNSIIWGNSETTENPVINKDNASPEYKFSLLQASGGSDAWAWDVSQDRGFNIDSDPLFINPESNFRITDASPAAEQGDIDLYQSITDQNIAGEYSYYVDLAMNRRASLVNEEYVISMGAYESVECPAFITPSLGIVYVTETGSGAMDGSSWADAYPGLADPLKYAADHFGCITEIWVARGTYYPEHKIAKASKPYFYLVWDSEQEMYYKPYSYPVEYYDLSDERDKAFMLVEGIKVYGGFAGMEASPEERDDIHGTNQTILSGDIDYAITGDLSLKDDYTIINADNSYANTSGNAYHVVVAAGKLTENTVLDGFKIEGGSALYRVEMYDENDDENPYYAPTVALDPSGMYSSEEIEKSNGGGIYIGELANPALSNLIINSNFANEFGGGIYTLGNYSGGTPSTDYSIPLPMSAHRNIAPMTVNTDALGNIGNDALKIQFVEISNNIALVGGGIFAKTENLFVKNFDIHHNTTFGYMTEYYGMAGDIGGGVYTDGTMLTLLNGKVTDNTAGYAGGIYMRADGESPIPTRLAVRTVADDRNKDGIYYSLTNTTISGNHARNELQGEFNDRFYMGGLVVDDGMYSPCSHKAYAPIGDIYNTIIWGNTQGADYNIANLILGFNVKEGADNEFVIMSAFAHSLVEESNGSGAGWDKEVFGIDGGDNIDTIPYFVDYGGGNYRLLPNSPAIEVGSNKLYLDKGGLMEDVDIAGNPRFWNAIDNSSIDPVIDMGAYEYSEKIIDCPDPGLTEYADGIFVNSLRNGYGESWECAFHSLYDALTRANEIISSNRPAPVIYVAKGSYYPEDFILEDPIKYTNERNKSFVIINGVHVYGGYPDDLLGNETADVLRIYKEETFLSGDIDRAVNPDHLDSQGTLTGREGNAYHVVVATDNINAVTKLDGFVITGGNADGLADYLYSGKVVPNSYGGGLYASGSISLNNILFKGNEADKAFGQGGGAYVSRFANTFGDEVSFTFNKAYKGGGLYSLNIEFTGVDFTYNSATYGGGMYLELTPSALSVSYSSSDFIGNSSVLYGGGVYIINESSADFEDLKFLANRAAAGGGIYRAIGTLNIQNLEFDENIATVYGGGGLYSEGTYSFQNKNELNITNTAFTNNRALSGNGGAIYNQFGHLNYGALTITANEAQGGSGGGIYNFESKIAPTGSDKIITLDENRAKYEGGGIANVDYTGINAASLYMTEGSISDNAVTNGLGGAVFNYGARLKLEAEAENRIPVRNNSASGEGGGIANYAGSVINAIWTNIINNQTEGYGGGISNSYLKADEESLLKNMNITNNLAENRSEAEVERGGAGINNIASSPKLMNVLLAQNLLRVNAGAGMYNILESNPELVNVTLAGNTAEKTVGSGLYNNNSNPVIYNTVIAKNNGTGKDFYHENVETLDIQYSLVHGAGILPLGSDGDIDANFNLADITEPRFRNAATGNFRLDETDEDQRLIDAGNNSLYFGSETIDNSEKDLDNQLRVANDEVKLIDIGAYESPSPHNVKVSMRAFLEGPLTQRDNEPVMTNFLQTGTDLIESQLPLENPYGVQGVICPDILDESDFAAVTDWILADVIRVVETEVEGKTKYNVDYLETKPLLLKSDGYIVDVDGEVPTFITQREPVFILLRHRNHLSVMTMEFTTGLLPHEEGGPDGGYIYDFTRAGAEPNTHKFNESDLNPMIEKYGVWCLVGGDVLEDGMVTGNGEINSSDESIVLNSMDAGDKNAYLRADIDMNGEVNSSDHTIVSFGLSKGFYSTITKYLGH